MDKVLFVCVNNVGRSQWAESIYNESRPGQAESAGTLVDDPGGTVDDWAGGPELILQAQLENGVDMAKNLRAQLTEDMLKAFRRVVVIAQPESWPAYLRIGNHIESWEIADPANMGIEEVRAVRSMVKLNVERLLNSTS